MSNDIKAIEESGILQQEVQSRVSIPVSVVIERRIDRQKKWPVPNWSLYAIVADESVSAGENFVQPAADADVTRYFHAGLSLDLFKDGGEGYWYNLLSSNPYLFVICDGEQTDQEITPYYVTANQDEATGYLESDDIVLSAPMPEQIRELLERYVVTHYQPEIKKKRKRKDWLEDSLYTKTESETNNQSG